MKTKVLFAVRCNPSQTIKKLEAIDSKATAFVTELISNKKGENFISKDNFTFQREWRKVNSFIELKKAAESGKDVLYKTASLSHSHKMYVRK